MDESGSSDLLCKATPTSTPVLVVAGLIVPGDHVRDLVWDFLQLKKRFNPSLATASWLSDVIRYEVIPEGAPRVKCSVGPSGRLLFHCCES